MLSSRVPHRVRHLNRSRTRPSTWEWIWGFAIFFFPFLFVCREVGDYSAEVVKLKETPAATNHPELGCTLDECKCAITIQHVRRESVLKKNKKRTRGPKRWMKLKSKIKSGQLSYNWPKRRNLYLTCYHDVLWFSHRFTGSRRSENSFICWLF